MLFWASIVFTAAAITDMLDGYLARKLGVVSLLGKFLDPLADKLMVMASLVWMVPMGRIAIHGSSSFSLAREISVTGLRSVAATGRGDHQRRTGGQDEDRAPDDRNRRAAAGLSVPHDVLVFDCGTVQMVHVGRALVYLSLLFSIASAAQYVRLFGTAVAVGDHRQVESWGFRLPVLRIRFGPT